MQKETSLNREICFQSTKTNRKLIDGWPLPDDFIEVFVSFFKEFGWKIEDCLNLSIGQIRTIVEAYVNQNTPKNPRIKTKDKNITIIDDTKKTKKTLNQLVKEKEKELNRKLTVDEMNQLIDGN